MRKVIAALFISLDGVTEAPNEWQFDHFDADMMEAMESTLADVDTVLMGRITYQEWMNYWPNSTDEPFASFINNTPKVVVSSTLDRVGWGTWDNIRLMRGSVEQEIARLKLQPGKNISIAGSMSLVRSLLQDDLIDELTLMLHPVIAGKGRRLFDDWSDLKRLRLVYSKTTVTGVMILTYQPLIA